MDAILRYVSRPLVLNPDIQFNASAVREGARGKDNC